KEVDPAIEVTRGFQGADQVGVVVEAFPRFDLVEGEPVRLGEVVSEDLFHYVTGAIGQQSIPLLPGELSPRHRQTEEDLEVDLSVRAVDSRRVVAVGGVD